MRGFPIKRSKNQKIIIERVKDFFGPTFLTKEEIQTKKVITLFLLNRKKGLRKLTEEELGIMEIVKNNIRDPEYRENLLPTPY